MVGNIGILNALQLENFPLFNGLFFSEDSYGQLYLSENFPFYNGFFSRKISGNHRGKKHPKAKKLPLHPHQNLLLRTGPSQKLLDV